MEPEKKSVLDFLTGGKSVDVLFEHTIAPKTLLLLLGFFLVLFAMRRAIVGKA